MFGGFVNWLTGLVYSGIREAFAWVYNIVVAIGLYLFDLWATVWPWFVRLWDRILKPFLLAAEELLLRVHRIINDVLRPALEILHRIRDVVLLFYDTLVRPILQTLSVMRVFLRISRLHRTEFGRRLDAKLRRLESKTVAPILDLLAKANELGFYVNEILDIAGILRARLWLDSMRAYRGSLTRIWWNAHQQGLDAAGIDRLASITPTPALEDTGRAFRSWIDSRSGPFANDVEAALDVYEDAKTRLGVA